MGMVVIWRLNILDSMRLTAGKRSEQAIHYRYIRCVGYMRLRVESFPPARNTCRIRPN